MKPARPIARDSPPAITLILAMSGRFDLTIKAVCRGSDPRALIVRPGSPRRCALVLPALL
jgi:hypothetical protein